VEGTGTTRGISLETLFKICEELRIQPGRLLDEEE
jgi:DNA-binding Xre family transcriptional regulator